jgi:predicted ATPase/transcriptional regulator with XRE-family HTH domain
MHGESTTLFNFEDFGSLLKHLRRRARLTQKELSIAVGYSESQISRLESNKRAPDKSAVSALFIPVLGLEHEPEVIQRLLALAESQSQRTEMNTALPLEAHDGLFEDSLKGRKGNLPKIITSFVGREHEIEQVCALLGRKTLAGLPAVRLLTLLGPGGVGKSRLSIHIGEVLEQSQPGGAWVVELAPVVEPNIVPRKIMQIFDLPGDSSRPDRTVLIEYLRSREMLLIVDNCEHLIEVVAELTMMLLENCPKLQILVTSREPLNIPGEAIFRVPSLTLPNLKESSDQEISDAVCLFLDRAQAVQPDFTLTPDALPVVNQICQRMDGIPLAIELAAARLNVLSVEAIAARLDNAFQLLASGSRGLPPRQQSLRATIEWSYELLSPPEQKLLLRLSVFAGRWSLEAAETICADMSVTPLLSQAEVIDLLAQLVNKSLVWADTDQVQPRYHLHEFIRQFAQEHLRSENDLIELQKRHLDYFLQLCESWEPHLRGPDQVTLLDQLEEELDNIRAALTFSLREPSMGEKGLRMVIALRWLWHIRSLQREGVEWLERLLAVCPLHELSWPVGAAARGRALADCAFMRINLRKRDNQALLQESQMIYRSLGGAYKIEMIWLLNMMEIDAYWSGDMQRGRQHSAEALALAEELGDRFYMAEVLDMSLSYASSLEEELRLADRSLTLRRSLGDVDGIYSTIFYRAHIYSRMGEHDQALQDAREALKFAQMGKNQHGIARVLLSMGRFYFTMGAYKESFLHFNLAIDKLRSLGNDSILGSWFIQVGGLAAWLEATTGEGFGVDKYLDEALDIAHRLSDLTIEAETAFYRAELAWWHGDTQKAMRGHLAVGSLFDNVDEPRAARLYHYSLGKAALLNADWKAANEHFLSGLRSAVEQKDLWDILHYLAALAVVKVSCSGEEELAARLQGTVDQMRPVTNIVDFAATILYFPFHPQMVIAAAQDALGEMRFADAYAEGQRMTFEQAVASVFT